jgi:hypothetical protein
MVNRTEGHILALVLVLLAVSVGLNAALLLWIGRLAWRLEQEERRSRLLSVAFNTPFRTG